MNNQQDEDLKNASGKASSNNAQKDKDATNKDKITLTQELGKGVISLGIQAEEQIIRILNSYLVKIFGIGVIALIIGVSVYFFTEMYGFNGRVNRIEGLIESNMIRDFYENKKQVELLRSEKTILDKKYEIIKNEYSELKNCILENGIKDKRGCIK